MNMARVGKGRVNGAAAKFIIYSNLKLNKKK
jgi:hypothetical protein